MNTLGRLSQRITRKTEHSLKEMFQLGETLSALENGEVIVYPTDTVWGIGCDATNPQAVEKILRIKERKVGQGVVVLVDSLSMLKKYINQLHPRLETLLSHHLRPLTMIYTDPLGLSPNVLASDGSAAIRICSDVYCQELIKAFGKPITSASATLSGESFPGHYGSISSEILRQVDHVVKYRQRDNLPADPSIIARWTDQNEIDLIRE